MRQAAEEMDDMTTTHKTTDQRGDDDMSKMERRCAMESPNDAPWSECGNGCGAMVEHPNLLAPAPWCAGCNARRDLLLGRWRRAAQYREFEPNAMGYRDGLDDPALVERAAIVAWLRQQPFLIEWPWAAAAGIERGEHLRGDDE